MALPIQGSGSYLGSTMTSLKQELYSLNNQLSSGLRAQDYVSLATNRDLYSATQYNLSEIEAYQHNTTMVKIRFDTITSTLNSVDQTIENMIASFEHEKLNLNDDVPTLSQRTSQNYLDTVVESLNIDIAGRHVFGGRKTDQPPLIPAHHMMDGADGKAGFIDVMSERWQADQGASGTGRLTLTRTNAEVSLAEDAASHPFGLKITNVTSSLSGVSANGPSAPLNNLNIDFSAANLNEDETLTIDFTLPTGAAHSLTLTAVTASDDNVAGTFIFDNTDTNVTAENFRAALEALIQSTVDHDLKRDSALKASEDFFFSAAQGAPLRPDTSGGGDPTSLITATSDTTLFWYQGDASQDDPRSLVQAKVSQQITVDYGMLANEAPFTSSIRNLAVLSAFTFDSDTEAGLAAHKTMRETLSASLADAQSSNGIEGLHKEVTFLEGSLARAEADNSQAKGLAEGIIVDIQDVDNTELAVRLNALITQIEASYKVNQRLQSLSLLNYI